ncbi:MAG: carboxypeptidase-like regulatory domain-containing protein [Bacteroidota bacterium]
MRKSIKEKAIAINGAVLFVTEDGNVTIINTNLTTKNDVAHFIVRAGDMNDEIEKALIDVKGVTKNQNTARSNLSVFMYDKICSPSLRYAREKKDDEIKAVFNYTRSKIAHYQLSEVVPFCNKIFDKATFLLANDTNYGTLTNITSGIVTEGRALLSIVNGYLGQPKNTRSNKNIALKNVRDIQKDIFEYDFENFINDASFFVEDYPDFAEAFVNITTISNLPTHHTALFGNILDEAGNPVIGCMVTNLDLPKRKSVISNNLGRYADERFRCGVYRFKFSHPLFEDKLAVLKINRGTKLEYNVVLKKKA